MKENKKSRKGLKRILITIVLIFIVFVVAGYVTSEETRNFINKNLLGKKLDEETIKKIEINTDENPKIYAFSKYICMFSKNELKFYDYSTNLVSTLNVEMSSPIMKSNGKYLIMAEENGKSICLINDTNVLWRNEVEGNITSINVNKNGYVTVVVNNNTYKSIIYTYNKEGTQLFKSYRSTTLVVGTDISKDNKYLVFGEIDYSGINAKSKINIVSIEKAVKEPNNSIEREYEVEQGKVIINIKFANNNDVIVMYNDNITKYIKDTKEEILKINEDIIFAEIGLKGSIISFEKESSGKFSFKYKVRIKDEEKQTESFYILNSSVPKNVITNENVIAMNFGTEVKIINTNGWLIKEYESSKQIKDIVLGNSIAGIIYKDRIEVINF